MQLVQDDRTGAAYATGWIPRPAAVAAVQRALVRAGKPSTFEAAAPHLMAALATDEPVFFWEAESKILGRVLASWDQKQVGSCVSFGTGRASQDLILGEITLGQPEKWPGYEVATEPIYGGSRVEIGGGGISGDGSVGAWAAKYVQTYGLLVRKSYQFSGQTYDLTTYSESRCRQYGESGVPDALEPEARLHPVKEIALVTTADGLWAALGARKPVPVCSSQGFTMSRDSAGFCARSGSWAHCMAYRGRFVHPTKGRCVVEQNSWGDYLGGPAAFQYVDALGSTRSGTLPQGCFCVPLTVAAEALAEQDSWALAGLTGWAVDPVPPGPGPGPVPPPSSKGTVITRLVGNQLSVNYEGRQISATLNADAGRSVTGSWS